MKYIVKGPDGTFVNEVLPTGQVISTDCTDHAIWFNEVRDAQEYMYFKRLFFPNYVVTGLTKI